MKIVIAKIVQSKMCPSFVSLRPLEDKPFGLRIELTQNFKPGDKVYIIKEEDFNKLAFRDLN